MNRAWGHKAAGHNLSDSNSIIERQITSLKNCAKNLNSHFSREYTQWPINTGKYAQHHKPPSEIQIKATMRGHFTPIRMARIKRINKCW